MAKRLKTGPVLYSTEHFNIAKLWYLIEEKVCEGSQYLGYMLDCKVSEEHWPYASIRVPYELPQGGLGRLIPKSFCFIQMKREVRATIADGLYLDIDMVNCHPTLLWNALKELDCKSQFSCLQKYVENREEVLNDIGFCFPDRKAAKQWLLKVIYGGIGIDENQPFNSFMEDYESELKHLDVLIANEETLWEYDLQPIRDSLLARCETENLSRKILSVVLNAMERSVFDEAQKFFAARKCDLSIYCYDGGMSYKPANSVVVDDQFLKLLSEHIYLSLNIQIEFAFKNYADDAIFVAPNKLNLYRYAKFKEWVVDQRGDYTAEKAKFEKFNFFGTRDVLYYTEEPLMVRQHNVNEFKHKYEHLVYKGEDKKGNPILKQFMPEWVKDPEKRRYDIVGLFPPGFEMEETEVTFYSKWKGFAVERILPDGSNYGEAVARFRDHTLYICSYNEQYRNFLEKCIVHILTYPGKKLDIVIAFKAIQGGEGKNTWWEIHKELFGHNFCYSTQNHERDWFGDFNELLNEKLWLHMEEMSKFTLLKHQKSFLAYVTSKYDTLNFKGGAKRSVPSFCNYFVTFNTGGMDMFPGLRRRLWVHELDKNIPIRGSTYFQALYTDMKNPQAIRAYYDWLIANVNIDKFVPAEDRPITPYMERLFEKEHLAKNSAEEFVVEALSTWFYSTVIPNHHKLKFKEVHKMYTEKCKEDQVQSLTPAKLASALSDMFVEGITRKKIKGSLFLEFDIDTCIQTLVDQKMMAWEDLGDVQTYEDCVYKIIRPCKKLCKFKDCRAHLSYIMSDDMRAVRAFRQRHESITHTCECNGSYFIGQNGH